MRIAIIDCAVSGHRETYYKQFARTLLESGNEVVLIAPDGEGLPREVRFSAIPHLALKALPQHQPIRKKLTVLRNAGVQLYNLYLLRKKIKQFKPDRVFFACLDDMLPTLTPMWLLNLLLPVRWSGLLVQSMLPPYKSYLPDVRRSLRSKNCTGMGVLNEYSVDELLPFQSNVTVFPDFADLSAPNSDYDLLKRIREKATGRKIVALLGSIHPRKGVDLFLRSCEGLPQNEYFFLIAGKPSLSPAQLQKITDFEKAHPNTLFSLERIPDEACFNALVAESDLIFAVYTNFTGSSNLLTKAAAFCKPVVVGSGVCMRRRVEKHQTGISIPSGDESACVAAIEKLCKGEAIAASCFSEYAEGHRTDRLKGCFSQLFDSSRN